MQAVADAYYVLSDPTRRREYDALYASQPSSDRTAEPNASSNFFANFSNLFTGTSGASPRPEGDAQRPDPEGVFGDVFEEVGTMRFIEPCIAHSQFPDVEARDRSSCTLVDIRWISIWRSHRLYCR